jgi:hypothetical protein
MRLYGMRRKGQPPVVKNLTFNDRSSLLVGSTLQPFGRGNQSMGVVHLFGSIGTTLHHAHGQRRHITVESDQLSE